MNEEMKEVDESIGLFEAALRAGKVTVGVPKVARIAALLDGSDQDPTVEALAARLAARLGAELERAARPDVDDDAAAVISALRPIAERNDLVIVPVPYGEDIGSLKSESLSSVIDLMLAEFRRPLLVVRRIVTEVDAVLSRPLALLEWHEDLQGAAASWTALLAARGGSASLMAGHDPELLDEVRAIFDDHADDLATFESLIQRAATRLAGGLVSALQKLGEASDFAVDFKNVGAADLARAVLDRARTEERLVVAAYRRGATGPTLNRVRELILRSDLPILVIPC